MTSSSPVVDMHCHVFPDSLAPRAIDALHQKCSWQALGDGTRAGLLASMDTAGIGRAVVCMVATRPGQEDNILSFCRELKSDRLIPLVSVHPDTPKPDCYIEQIAHANLIGIKVHPLYQDCPIDAPAMDTIFAAAKANNLLVIAHCGLDIAFGDSELASPERIARMLKRHPGLKFVAAHLGGWKNWDQVLPRLFDFDIFLECSFSLQYLPPDQARDLILRFGTDRILFGSDWPWADQAQTIQLIHQLDLSPKQQRDILSQNATKLIDSLKDDRAS